MAENYPSYYEPLQSLIAQLGHDIPATMSGLGALHNNAVAEGKLPAPTTELIAMESPLPADATGVPPTTGTTHWRQEPTEPRSPRPSVSRCS